MLVFAAVLWWYSRLRSMTARSAMQWAALLQLAACLIIAVPLGPVPVSGAPAGVHGISWACVLIVIFPLMIQGTARFHVIMAVICASLWPLYQLFLQLLFQARGLPPLQGAVVVDFAVPPFLCVGIVLVMARITGKMRAALEQANEEAETARAAVRELGCYALRNRLGQGGMGEVWQAEHRMLARPAAIKLIRPDQVRDTSTTEETVFQRFEQEARATALLRSQHTVELYDYGRTEDGAFYYVMELLDGSWCAVSAPSPPGG